jgi:hypothetical protein
MALAKKAAKISPDGRQEMQLIRLYDWNDVDKQHPLREVRVLSSTPLTRNGKERVFVWTGDDEEFNYTLYPQYGTAYPEYDSRIQQQRIAKRYLYDAVD